MNSRGHTAERLWCDIVTAPCTHNSLSVVLIDDDDEHRDLLRRAIVAAFATDIRDVKTIEFQDPEEGLAGLPADEQTVILIDYSLDGTTGTEWISDFVRSSVGSLILITSNGDENIAREAFQHGASDYLVKADVIVSPDVLRRSIDESLRRYRLEATNRSLATKLKRTNSQLERKNARLAELTSIAHRFVDDVAHEFRTPLAVIKEFASILNDGIGGSVTDQQHDYLEFISTAARDLSGLVDDFLDSSKLRSQSLRVQRRSESIDSVLDAVWPLLESRAAARGISLERAVAEDLPPVFIDGEKAGRCLINLVVNAVKFAPAGGTVTIGADRGSENEVRVSVHDRGPGMPPEAQARLFDRFHQTGPGVMTEVKGFGLGLSIVQQLATLNLGEVDVSSTLGEGSTFSFTLPVDRREAVLDAILAQAASGDASSSMTALEVIPHAQADLSAAANTVAKCCYSGDVVWPAASSDRLLIIGSTRQAEAWRMRLEELITEQQSVGGAESEVIRDVSVVGQWPITQSRDQLLRNMACTEWEGTHGILNSDRR